MRGKTLGLLLSAAAAVQLVWSAGAMGRVLHRCGSQRACVGSCAVGCVALLLLPHTYAMPVGCIIALVATQSAALATATTATIIATNQAVEQVAPELAGAINGVIVTVESVAKALGPALGAPLFALLVSQRPAAEVGFPSGTAITFATFAALLALLGCASHHYLCGLDQ
jgi:MFS family permease